MLPLLCQEAPFEAVGMARALPILNAAQSEVNLWLVTNSIPDHPNFDSVDMDVESVSAAFFVKYSRYGNCMEDQKIYNPMWCDEIFLKIRALVRERTRK